MKSSFAQLFLRLLVLMSLLLNAVGLYWGGYLVNRQLSCCKNCQAEQEDNVCAAQYIYSDSATWLAQGACRDFYYIKRFATNDVFAVLKVADSHLDNTIQFFVGELLVFWSYDDAGRCGKILLVKKDKGLFDEDGDGSFRKLSLAEIDKFRSIIRAKSVGRTDSQKHDSPNGWRHCDL